MSRLQKERQGLGKGADNGQNRNVGRNHQPNPRISDLGEHGQNNGKYDPLALFKNKLATDGIGEIQEGKKVSKHLGGNKKDPIRTTKQSGNFEKLGETENGEGKESTNGETEYDAFQKFKEKLRPAETIEKPKKTWKVDKGKAGDGVVSFGADNKDSIKKGRKRKMAAYHSDSDSSDEEGDEGEETKVKSSSSEIKFAKTFENEENDNKIKKVKEKKEKRKKHC